MARTKSDSVPTNDKALSIIKDGGDYHIVEVSFDFKTREVGPMTIIETHKERSLANERFKVIVVGYGLMGGR